MKSYLFLGFSIGHFLKLRQLISLQDEFVYNEINDYTYKTFIVFPFIVVTENYWI